MDNKLNEIRRKIRFLRAEMLGAADNIRKQVDQDEDCSEAALHLMAMRVVMLGLIGERNRLGGEERLLNARAQLLLSRKRAELDDFINRGSGVSTAQMVRPQHR